MRIFFGVDIRRSYPNERAAEDVRRCSTLGNLGRAFAITDGTREGAASGILQPPGTKKMNETRDCIYCEETKPVTAFNREHVLPEAFGTYANNNFVLHGVVCQACNSYFDKELDRPLARDSKEGLDRFAHGVVEPKRGRKVGTRVAVTVRGGVLDGAPLKWEVDESGTQLKVNSPPQIGIGPSENGPFEWYRPDEVPPVETLRARGTFYCVVGGMSSSDAAAFMTKHGIDAELPVELPDPRDADGTIGMTIEGVIDQRLRRAIAKISFNYFAYCYPDIMRLEQYRRIRRYIRFDEKPETKPVSIIHKPIVGGISAEKQILAHVIATRWDGPSHRTVAQVSLFEWVQYEVVLSSDKFVLPPWFVDSGHAFNPAAKQIVPLTRDPRLAEKDLPLMTKEEFRQKQAREAVEASPSGRSRKGRHGSGRGRP